MQVKPVFIPLKGEHYENFVSGNKTKEYRIYGKGWNERVCRINRPATLSFGYGKGKRTAGVISSFEVVKYSDLPLDMQQTMLEIYPNVKEQLIAVIGVDIEEK